MTYIDVYVGDGCTRHQTTTSESVLTGGDVRWHAHTACDRNVRGRDSGECAPSAIDCRACRTAA